MVVLEIAILLVLILLNGFFAMSELAVVSARRARLAAMEAAGVRGARAARKLAEDPGRFLSSVQIGITLVGVLAGAFGGATLAGRLSPLLVELGLSDDLAGTVAVILVVLVVTYLSLIVGELVPKQIALRDPERIATLVAFIMRGVARFAAPAVWLLECSSNLVLRLFSLHGRRDSRVSEEEIRALIAEAETAADDPALRVTLLVALRTLAPLDRAVAVLRYWEDRSVEETAHALLLSQAAVKNRALRALATLRAELDELRAPLPSPEASR